MSNDDVSYDLKRRLLIEMFVVHPTLLPSEISAGVGLEPEISSTVGAPRTTPMGTALTGNYPDTRWRHVTSRETHAQHFADCVDDFVRSIIPYREFIRNLSDTGGEVTILIVFLEGYFSDSIHSETLQLLADLKMKLGIECFLEPDL